MVRVGENWNIFIYSSIFSEDKRGIGENGIKDAKFLLLVETCCKRCVTYAVILNWLMQPYIEIKTNITHQGVTVKGQLCQNKHHILKRFCWKASQCITSSKTSSNYVQDVFSVPCIWFQICTSYYLGFIIQIVSIRKSYLPIFSLKSSQESRVPKSLCCGWAGCATEKWGLSSAWLTGQFARTNF